VCGHNQAGLLSHHLLRLHRVWWSLRIARLPLVVRTNWKLYLSYVSCTYTGMRLLVYGEQSLPHVTPLMKRAHRSDRTEATKAVRRDLRRAIRRAKKA